MAAEKSKVMGVREAIDHFVHDGDELVMGNYTVGSSAELVYEVVRQGRRGLTLYSQSGIFNLEVLVCAGCADKLLCTYYGSTFHKGDDPATKELYLAQIHPRVSIEEVKKDVPRDL